MFKWIPGPLDKKFAREENRWQPIGEVVQEQAGRLVWRYQAAAPGDVLDVKFYNSFTIIRGGFLG